MTAMTCGRLVVAAGTEDLMRGWEVGQPDLQGDEAELVRYDPRKGIRGRTRQPYRAMMNGETGAWMTPSLTVLMIEMKTMDPSHRATT